MGMLAPVLFVLAATLCTPSAGSLESVGQLTKLPREFRQPHAGLGEVIDQDGEGSAEAATSQRNTTAEQVVPVDLEKMIEESKAKAEKVQEAANALTAVEVNASNTYARWDETKAELMKVNKKFPVEPIMTMRYPQKPEDIPNPPQDDEAIAQAVGLKPANNTEEKDQTAAEIEAEMDSTDPGEWGLS